MAAPTFPVTADLVEGTGTRAFGAVTTQAGDYVVVECIGQDGNLTALTPTATGLTFTQQTNVGDTSHAKIQHWTAPDAAGGSRTVTITPTGVGAWRAHLTVVRGSNGPGVTGTALTGQTVSVTRTGNNSGMFEAVGDFAAGAVGSPVWTPGGATIASQQNAANCTYIFGRWNDSGAIATVAHGISSPSYATPSVAVLEMLGTAGSTPVAVGDTGSSTEAATVTATAATSEAGSAVDTVTAAVTATVTESASGTEALAVTVPVALSDAGSVADTLAATATVALADAASSAESLSVSATASLADAASGADSVTVNTGSNPALADGASSAEALTVTVTASLADTGSAADQLALTVTLTLADAAAAADSVSATVSGTQVALADSASASDTVSALAQLALAESASALEALAVTVAGALVGAPGSMALGTKAGSAAGGTSAPGFTSSGTSGSATGGTSSPGFTSSSTSGSATTSTIGGGL